LSLGSQVMTKPLSPSLGLEIRGLDIRGIAKRNQFDEIKRLLVEHQVLAFKDQALAPEDLDAFTRLFGQPDQHVLTEYALDGYPDIFVISNIVRNGRPIGSRSEGFAWHTDLIYFEYPAAYTILYALEVPPEGGNTLFTSLYRAYDALPEEERAQFKKLQIVHSYSHMYAAQQRSKPLTAEQLARTPDVTHPMVRVHPDTGREGLYVNKGTVKGIVGMESEEAKRLIDRLFAFAQQDRFIYSHKWTARDLVIWDNRGALHTATPYDMERHRRLIYRTSVRGERPMAAVPDLQRPTAVHQ
jgi:taurine dioxygenase